MLVTGHAVPFTEEKRPEKVSVSTSMNGRISISPLKHGVLIISRSITAVPHAISTWMKRHSIPKSDRRLMPPGATTSCTMSADGNSPVRGSAVSGTPGESPMISVPVGERSPEFSISTPIFQVFRVPVTTTIWICSKWDMDFHRRKMRAISRCGAFYRRRWYSGTT